VAINRGNLYKIQKADISRAGNTLASAFHNDSVWKMFFKDESTIMQKGIFFQVPIRYCFHYGDVYSTSEKLEGIAAWVSGKFADQTIWRIIRSGGIIYGLKAMKYCTQLMQKQSQIFEPLESDRRENMRGRNYLYLMVIGVTSEMQGQGFGGKLLGGIIEKSNQEMIPIYTETHTEINLRFYEKNGFKPIKKITLPIINIPQWELIRDPGN
jgi:hypothetical protein